MRIRNPSPSIIGRVGQVIYGHWDTRQMPTKTFENNITLATAAFAKFKPKLNTLLDDIETYENVLTQIGAPYTKGRKQ